MQTRYLRAGLSSERYQRRMHSCLIRAQSPRDQGFDSLTELAIGTTQSMFSFEQAILKCYGGRNILRQTNKTKSSILDQETITA
jgi:hypothetical protein